MKELDKVYESVLKEGLVDNIIKICHDILNKYNKKSGKSLLNSPLRTEFKNKVKPFLPKITSKTLRQLENENYHSAVEIITQDFNIKMESLNNLYESWKQITTDKDNIVFENKNGDMIKVQMSTDYFGEPSYMKKGRAYVIKGTKTGGIWKETPLKDFSNMQQALQFAKDYMNKNKESLSPLDNLYESVCKEDFYPNFEIVKQKKDANGFTILEVTGDDKKGVVDYAKQVLGYKVRSANKIGSNKYVIYTGNKENLKEELKVDAKYIKTLKDNNIDFEKVGDKLLVDESNDKVLSGLGIPYRELFEVRFNNGQTKRFSKYSDAQIYAGNRKKLKPVIVDLSKEKENLDNLYESVYIENAKGRDDLLDAIQSYISSPQLKNYRVQSRRGDKLSAADDDNIYEIIIK